MSGFGEIVHLYIRGIITIELVSTWNCHDDCRIRDGNPWSNEELVFKYQGLVWGQKLKVTSCEMMLDSAWKGPYEAL